MMVEVVLSMLALSVVGVTVVQTIVVIDRARRSSEHIDMMSRELENILADYSSRPYDELASLDTTTLRADFQAEFEAAQLEIIVNDESEPAAKRITAVITFSGERFLRPLQLTRWVFAPQQLADGGTRPDAEEEE
jgi:hypothetical protein